MLTSRCPGRRAAIGMASLATLLIAQQTFGSGMENNRRQRLTRLRDESHILSSGERAEVEQRLTDAAKRLTSPLYVDIVAQLHRETAIQMAERLLAERLDPDDAAANPVLLLLAISDDAAGVATGKGNAGIVPEMDAARIVKQLVAHRPSAGNGGRLARAIDTAIDAIVESGLATAARRRPLASADDDVSQTDDSTPSKSAAVPLDATDESGKPTLPAPSPRRSRMPMAAAIAALILLAIALRRRRNMHASRQEAPVVGSGKPRLPSVIDSAPPPHRRPPTGGR